MDEPRSGPITSHLDKQLDAQKKKLCESKTKEAESRLRSLAIKVDYFFEEEGRYPTLDEIDFKPSALDRYKYRELRRKKGKIPVYEAMGFKNGLEGDRWLMDNKQILHTKNVCEDL